jgi:F-type H+-transporting ATPase subunit delta
MSLNLKIVKNYSTALYVGAKKDNIESKVLNQISSLTQALLKSSLATQALCSPVIDNKIKKSMIDLVCSKFKFDKITNRFLYILIKNSRFSLLAQIAEDFANIIADSQGIKRAEVSSAFKLGTKEIGLISGLLEAELGKKIEIDVSIDPSLIGGAVIKYDCNLIDYSVRGALERIKKVATGSKI